MPSQAEIRQAPSAGQDGSDGLAAVPPPAAGPPLAAMPAAVQWSAAAGAPLPPLSPIEEGEEGRLLGRLRHSGALSSRSLHHGGSGAAARGGGSASPPLHAASGGLAAGEPRCAGPDMGQMPMSTNRALGSYITEVSCCGF